MTEIYSWKGHSDKNKSLGMSVNTLPDDKILGLPKLKAFADDKLNVTQNIKVVFHRIENIVGKEEKAGYQCIESHHCVVKG